MRLVSLLLLCCCTGLWAQQYAPLLEPNKIWTVESSDRIILPPEIFQLTYRDIGDTTINGTVYRNMVGAFLREEVLEQKVYALGDQNSDEECLLFDFSAEVGDSVDLCYIGKVRIDSINLIQLKNGEERRKFYFSRPSSDSPEFDFYIEGIGTGVGLFWYNGLLIGPPSFALLCVTKDNVELFGDRCDEVTSVEERSGVLEAIRVYPNPAGEEVWVEAPVGVKGYWVVDQWGRVLQRGELNGGSVGLSDLDGGNYWMVFLDRSQAILKVEKLLIIK